MAEELYDLDAAKAAQREVTREPFQFSYAGEKYEIPSSPDWPIEVFTHIAAKDFRAALTDLLSANDAEAPQRFMATRPTLGHFELVFDELARREGLTDASDLPPAPPPGSPPT
jgi:hypothetical protein